LASSEIIAIANTFLDKYGGQPHHQSNIEAQVHGFRTKNHEEVLEALLQDTPIIGQPLQRKNVEYLNNMRPGAMPAIRAWGSLMRYKFRSIPLRAASEFAVALSIHVGRGQPKTVSLQQPEVGMTGRTLVSILDQYISLEVSFHCIIGCTASGEQVPLTPPQLANWIYQALIDVTSELIGLGRF
jgi:hypothetical protein